MEGDLALRVAWDGQQVRTVSVHSSRAHVTTPLTRGKLPAVAADLVPRLYSLCTHAHRGAAAAAISAMLGQEPAVAQTIHAPSVRVELLQEHSVRLALAWPQALGLPPAIGFVRDVRKACQPALDADGKSSEEPRAQVLARALAQVREGVHVHLHDMPAERWLQLDTAGFDAWCEASNAPAAIWMRHVRGLGAQVGASAVPLMPPTTPDAIRLHVLPALQAAAAYVVRPAWSGEPMETGALARMCGHPLVASLLERLGNTVETRMAARLTELALLLDDARHVMADGVPVLQAMVDNQGAGVAIAQTARGMLLHRIRLREGVVRDYAVVAPTEWNFHPEGPAVLAIRGIAASDRALLEQRIKLIVQALDPCVRCTVEIGHA